MSIRRRLIALAFAFMASVVAGMIATPGLICQMRGEGGAVEAALVCTCGHGEGAQCPMHKHHRSNSSSPTPNRLCAGCHGRVDLITMTLISLAGPITDRSEIARPDGTSVLVRPFVEGPLEFVRQPISPPPRG